jgi:hypothetical protein
MFGGVKKHSVARFAIEIGRKQGKYVKNSRVSGLKDQKH